MATRVPPPPFPLPSMDYSGSDVVRFDFCLIKVSSFACVNFMCSDFMCCCLFLFEVREKKKEEILPLAFGDGGEVDRRCPRMAGGEE